jgi:hypothetical protein
LPTLIQALQLVQSSFGVLSSLFERRLVFAPLGFGRDFGLVKELNVEGSAGLQQGIHQGTSSDTPILER